MFDAPRSFWEKRERKMKNWIKKVTVFVEEVDSKLAEIEMKICKVDRPLTEIVNEKVEAGINIVITNSKSVVKKVRGSDMKKKVQNINVMRIPAIKRALRIKAVRVLVSIPVGLVMFMHHLHRREEEIKRQRFLLSHTAMFTSTVCNNITVKPVE